MRLPSRITDPSTMASTPSVLAISGTESCVFLKCIAEVREMTRRPWIMDSRPISSSVMPSAKYSWDGSPLKFSKGRTAKDRIAGDRRCCGPMPPLAPAPSNNGDHADYDRNEPPSSTTDGQGRMRDI